jgi:putative ABC transport system permease protein
MKLFTIIKISLRALWRNKLRSALTALGIIIGVGAVIAMVSIGDGARAMIEANVAAFGKNVVMVWAGNFSMGGVRGGWGSASTLTEEDAEAILNEVRGVIRVSPELNQGHAQITYGNQNWATQVMGQSPDFFEIRQWQFEQGSAFSELDVRGATKVCVLGRTVADQLFGGEDPINKVIRIRNVPFTVVGLLAPKGMNLSGVDQDNIIVAPHSSVRRYLARNQNLRAINVQVASAELMPEVQKQITELLRQRHKISGGREDDFTVRTQQEIAQVQGAVVETMRKLLAGIAAVSLIVGGIGIMNIMLVSVTERTREIGIRMAVGAHRKDILLQFLTEAFTLSSLGGSVGIAAGIGAAVFLSKHNGWPMLVSPQAVIVAFIFSAAVGIFFGFYPARKASRLDPIDALRFE